MSLSEEEVERLADVVRLQPTKNKELQERWGFESGAEVHHYLEDHLSEYYYRDENSLIRATEEAAELTGVEPGVTGGEKESGGIPETVRVPRLQAQILDVAPGPEEDTASVVTVLNRLRDRFDVDPEAGDVRRGLQSLRRKNVVEVVYRTVPTFRLTVPREELTVETLEDADGSDGSTESTGSTDRSTPDAPDSGPNPEGTADGDEKGAVLDELEEEFGQL